MKAAKPVIERIALASEGWSEAVNGLTVVERDGRLTFAERCARHLAITRAAMTPSELRDILTTARDPLTAAAIRRELQSHPAFTRLPGDKYELGRPACLPALEQAAAGPAEQALGAPTQLYPLSDVLRPTRGGFARVRVALELYRARHCRSIRRRRDNARRDDQRPYLPRLRGSCGPGVRVPLVEANVTGDPAAALADAWEMTDTRGGMPHVYDVGHDGEGLVVLGDVLVTGGLASEALGIVDTWRT